MTGRKTDTETLETLPDNSEHHLQPNNEDKTQTPKISLYEQSREERIKDNLQRMQQLGLKDLSNSLLNSNSRLSSKHGRGRPVGSKRPEVTPVTALPPPSAPVRRSSRLQNATPVSYSEVIYTKKGRHLEDVELNLKESEVYTEEHEKLLGNTKRSWTLFVDGYGSDGRRIYDPIKGKTCHQCRQKTLGHRTHCSKCNMVQGQFCGDCLYMRYGEHVLEANADPNWVCPVCRGICNCSLCRQAKGWPPTGTLYRKITQMGYKSVAHYLIQTRRVLSNVEKNPNSVDQVSAKRSLSFPTLEQPSQESSDVNNDQHKTSNPQYEVDGIKSEKNENSVNLEPNPTFIHQDSAKKSLVFSNSAVPFESGGSIEINLGVYGQLELSESDSGKNRDNGFISEHEKELYFMEREPNDDVHGQLGFSGSDSGKRTDGGLTCEQEKELHFTHKEPNEGTLGKNHPSIIEPISDSVTGRQREGCGEDNIQIDGTMGVNYKALDVKQNVDNAVSGKKLFQEKEMHDADDNKDEGCFASENSPMLKKRPGSAMEHSPDSIAERMKQRRLQSNDHDENTSSRIESKANIKHDTSGTNVDCIARRLRARNKTLCRSKSS